VADSVVLSLKVCWNDTKKPCLDRKNPSQMQRVDAIAELARLAGLPASQFDVSKLPPCAACHWAESIRD
jgi:hypothetical protein